MNSRFFFAPELFCNSGFAVAISSITPMGEEDRMAVSTRNRTPPPVTSSSFLTRVAIKISRSRCFGFLRSVFRYQNGLRTDQGSNPLNSGVWMVTELIVLAVQITIIAYTLAISEKERPVWPMRFWVSGYGLGCVLSLVQLFWRFVFVVPRRNASSTLTDIQQQRRNASSTLTDIQQQRRNASSILTDIQQQGSPNDPRYSESMNKYRAFLELFFAIWFVMGNVWMFDSRFMSFNQAPKLHILCISLLSWNAISYSFPFILFVLLCIIVPLLSTLTGYNMGSTYRGALDEQLSELSTWKYKEVAKDVENSLPNNENHECCICLAMYRDKEEIRQLPCLHNFHLKCIDQWLKIISCCPLCKKELQR